MITRITSQAPQAQVDEIVDVVNAAYAQQNFRKAGANRTDRREIHKLLKDRHYQLYAISEKVNGKIFGTIGLDLREGSIGLFSMLPDPKYKGRGKELLAHAEKMFLVYSFPNVRPLHLEVFPSQEGLIAYYVKNGFTRNGTQMPIAEEHKAAVKAEYSHFDSYVVLEKRFSPSHFDELIAKGVV